ncbi:MAG: poly-beta-1,6 N-acetyl-D-glucosamine export porin PgaA, partial [Pseudomonadales bacterium]
GEAAAAGAELAEARALSQGGGQADADPLDVHLACGYVRARAGFLTGALDCYQQAAAVAPQDAAAQRGLVRTAAALGAPQQALAMALQRPALWSPAEMLRLRQDAAAHLVRWASLPGTPVGDGPAVTALALQQDLAADLDAAAHAHLDLTYDRIAALAAAGRDAQAVTEFEALRRARPDLGAYPEYVLRAAARAALTAQRPGLAAELYQVCLTRTPHAFELQVGLFMAYSDQQRHDRARAVVERMLANQPPLLAGPAGAPRPNPDYTEAQTLAALELAYRDRYGEALDALDRLLAEAPGNSAARLARAEVLRWRGWTERADQDVTRVRSLDPENAQAAALAGQVAMDQRRYAAAHALLADLEGHTPEAPAAAALARRVALHQRPELVLRAEAGRSDGGAFSSRDWRLDGFYFSAPLAHRYRLFVHDAVRYGRFDEGIGRDHRLGVGAELRAPNWVARGEVNQGIEQNERAGAAVAAAWMPDDHWRLDVDAAVNGPAVPLRATRAGVRGREAGVGITHRWDETRSLRTGGGLVDFSDGNLRRSLWAEFEQRLLDAPDHQLVGTLRGYAGWNSERDRIYYNPASDRELGAAIRHDWRIFGRYDRGLTQRLELGAGRYRQQDFGSGNIWTLSLAHDWSLGPRTRLAYGLRSGGRVYDGEREHLASAFLTLEQRL